MAQNLMDFLPSGTGMPSGATMGGFSGGLAPATPVPFGAAVSTNVGAKGGGFATIFWSLVLLGTALFILHTT